MEDYTNKDVAEIFDKVRNGKLEIRPLFHDGSGRHPRYHSISVNEMPFEGVWFAWVILVYALFYIMIACPIVFIQRKVLRKEVSWPS